MHGGDNHKLFNHKPPPKQGKPPPDASSKLEADKKVLLRFFKERNYEHPDGGTENELGENKGGDKALLKAIDGENDTQNAYFHHEANGLMLDMISELVDAILMPRHDARSGFPLRVKLFFKENGMPLDPPKPNGPPDPFMERLKKLKGMEEVSELEKAIFMRNDMRKSEKNQTSIQAVEKKKIAKKVASAAGIVIMAEWMGRTMGKNKKDEAEEEEDDDDEDDKKRKDKGKGAEAAAARKAKAPKFGPWISNGLLERNHPKSLEYNTISQRLEASRRKMAVSSVTVEAGKMDAQAKSEQRAQDAQNADDFFQLLGWRDGASRELLDKLLDRAIHVAGQRLDQIESVRVAKARRQEVLRSLLL